MGSWNKEKHSCSASCSPTGTFRVPFCLLWGTAPQLFTFSGSSPRQETWTQSQSCCLSLPCTQSNIPFCTTSPSVFCRIIANCRSSALACSPRQVADLKKKLKKKENQVKSLTLCFAWTATRWSKTQQSPPHMCTSEWKNWWSSTTRD